MDSRCGSTSAHPASGSPQFIDNGTIELVSVIGTGAYGVVYLAIDSRYEQPVYRAVKCLRRHGLDARQRHFQRREIALHRLACSHGSIVTMDRLVEEGEYLYVVMDYGDEGDLFAMITDRQRYVGDDHLIRDVFLQLLDGVEYLHHLGIAHRDIKPENIVCSDDGRRVSICDFGLATSESVSSEFGCGSSFYIAPECLGEWFRDQTHYPTRAGDVWSLGVILVNLVCGRNPWRIASPADESFNAFLADPNFIRRILPVSRQCLFVLTKIFTVDPTKRISLATLRDLILKVDTFSMDEELRLTHAAAQKTSTIHAAVPACILQKPVSPVYNIVEEDKNQDWSSERAFVFDQEIPSLRTDSGSPSSPANFSQSSSSTGGSLPPTPLLSAEGTGPLPPPTSPQQLRDMLKHTNTQCRRAQFQLCINPSSPGTITAAQPNPYY